MIADAWVRFLVAGVLWIAIIAVLEAVRRQRINPLSWWIVHGPVLAWGAIALFPWWIALQSGFWLVPATRDTVPLDLPATYGFTLSALIGLGVGVAPFAFVGTTANRVPVRVRTKVVPWKAVGAIVLLFVVYLRSLPSLSSVWRLSRTAQEVYVHSSSSFLSLSIIALAGIAIGYLARQQGLGVVGIVLYLALLVAAVGSAHRYLILILILSFLTLRHPFQRVRAQLAQGLIFLVVGAAAVWLIGFGGIGVLSVLRSGAPVSNPSEYTQQTLSSFDVMGSAEYLFEAGGQPGQLKGASYLAIPSELVPHVLLGSRATPPAVAYEDNQLGPATGASAPLWIEGVLNLGPFGALFSMCVVAGLWCFLLRRATSSRRRLGRTVTAIGPVWILFAYQALSRILLVAVIELFASVILGLLLWNWMQVEDDPLGGSSSAMSGGESTDGMQSAVLWGTSIA
jgi:hypothetical protein